MGKNKSNSQQYVKTDINYDKLAEAIVKAYKTIKTTEEKESEKQSKEERKEWLNIIGYKEYSEGENWLLKKWHSMKNDFATLKCIFTFKAKDAKTPRLTFELIRLGTGLIYGLCEFLLYLLGAFFVVSPFVLQDTIPIDYAYIALGFLSVFFARIIRIAKLEVENIKDKELLNMIFSANMTFWGVILAVIAIIIQILQ